MPSIFPESTINGSPTASISSTAFRQTPSAWLKKAGYHIEEAKPAVIARVEGILIDGGWLHGATINEVLEKWSASRCATSAREFGPPFPAPQAPLAGKSPFLAESLMHNSEGAPILALGQEIAPQEASMAARQTSSQSLRSIAGAILLSLGFAILFVNLDAVASTVSDFADISGHEGLGVLPAVGLAGLHAAQAYTFDQRGFISALLQILVSFWPLVLIFAGAIVLHRALGRRSAATLQVCQQPETNDVRSY
jgi:hypothetical protein